MPFRFRREVGFLAIFAATFGIGCSGGADPPSRRDPCADGETTECWTARYFGGRRPPPLAACEGAPAPTPLNAEREIALFMGPKVSDEEVREQGALLQGFYEKYALTFFTYGPSQNAGFNYAMGGSEEDFEAVLEEVGLEPDEKPTEAQKAEIERRVLDIMFKNLRSFTKAQSDTSSTRVNVVVLETITSPDVRTMFSGGTIVGLGLSPALLRNIAEDDPSSDLFAKLRLPQDFTPILFLGAKDIKRLASNPAGTVAHEMGHALGLQHTKEPGNVMTQGQAGVACASALTKEQVDEVAAVADRIEDPKVVAESYETIVHVRDAIVTAVLARRAR